jgi:hypothetical protein
MNAQFRAKLAIYGQWTYRAAWGLEITAAVIGLATGLFLGYQAFSSSEQVTTSELTIASAPFFIVALAELTKIPVATLMFSAKWRWKPILAVFLLLLAGITFETVFMGLERALTLRQLKVEELLQKKRALTQENDSLDASTQRLLDGSIIKAAQDEVEKIFALAGEEQGALQKQIDAINNQLESDGSLSPEAKLARDRLHEAEQRRDALLKERDKEIADAMAEFEGQRDSYVRRIAQETDPKVKQQWQDELRRLANPRNTLTPKWEVRLTPIEGEIDMLRAAFEQERSKGTATSDAQRQVESRRDALRKQLDDARTKWNKNLDVANQALADAQDQAKNAVATVAQYRVRQREVSEELTKINSELIPIARTDQFRRIASRVCGGNPEDVSAECTAKVALVWNASLGLLAALAGPITAMVALGLQRAAFEDDRSAEGKLKRLIRRILLRWRWKRVRTVKVPVQVPIEVPVDRMVEKPVEKVVTEVLYVPLLTDNPEALVRALSNSDRIPKDVVDWVKINMTGGLGASGGDKAQHKPA